MAKKVAVIAFDPVNGYGLFQYLEQFFENNIPFKVFAVADSKIIKSNSGLNLVADEVIGKLKGNEDEFDALVFACGDAVPTLNENLEKKYNKTMMSVIKAFAKKDKLLIGHCAAGMVFDQLGIAKGKKVAAHPLAKTSIENAIVTDEAFEIDGNFFTAQTEETIWTMMPILIRELKR